MTDGTNLPTPATMEKFFENQRRELAIKEKEIDLEREKNAAFEKADERQMQFAREQLAHIERDRKNFIDYQKTLDKKNLLIVLAFIVVLAVFLTVSVWKDKDQMIIEIVKALVYAVPSGVGGYAFGRYKKNNGETQPPK